MTKQIWIVEHRTEEGKKCGCMECVISFVASSLKKAEQFIKKNKDYDSTKYKWWWVIYPESIDKDSMLEDGYVDFYVYSSKGKQLKNQPIK